MKNIMRGFAWLVVSAASIAYAGSVEEGAGMSLFGYLFLGFFALIIISQVVPAGILFFGMVKGVFFSREEKKAIK
ncbi:MAG: hypothetical protein FIB02_11630 [Desulfuromonas sp.]|nr:hypothetical protein [Desulfuromonas sp.]